MFFNIAWHLHVFDAHPFSITDENIMFGENVANDIAVGYVIFFYRVVNRYNILYVPEAVALVVSQIREV